MRLIFIAILIGVAFPTFSLPAATFHRRSLSLDGVWEICPDKDNRGLREKWFLGNDNFGWTNIIVPSSWETVLRTDFDGVAWY